MENNHETLSRYERQTQGLRRERVEHAIIISVGAQGYATPTEVLGILPKDMSTDIDDYIFGGERPDDRADATGALTQSIARSEKLSRYVELVPMQTDSGPDTVSLQLSEEGSVHFSETFYDTQDDDLRCLLMTILTNNAPEHFRQ